MVLIHLARMALLEASCDYFGAVFIPEAVKEEVIDENYPESQEIQEMMNKSKVKVKSVSNKNLIYKANQFNIQGAEAEAVALYWELDASLIATDDDNVRKKRDLLRLNVIGTPVILLKLYKNKRITKKTIEEAIKKLRKYGWFSSTIWDKLKLEIDKND